jgi:hypothetical protein
LEFRSYFRALAGAFFGSACLILVVPIPVRACQRAPDRRTKLSMSATHAKLPTPPEVGGGALRIGSAELADTDEHRRDAALDAALCSVSVPDGLLNRLIAAIWAAPEGATEPAG